MISNILPTQSCTVSPNINILFQSGIFVIIDELTLTHHYQPKSVVYIGFTLGVLHSMGLGKFIITCIPHYIIMQSNFIVQKILCAQLIYPSLSLNPQQALSPYLCLFQNVMQLESWNMQPFQIGLFYLLICIYNSSMFFHSLTAHFIIDLNILLSGCSTIYFCTYLLKDILIVSKF